MKPCETLQASSCAKIISTPAPRAPTVPFSVVVFPHQVLMPIQAVSKSCGHVVLLHGHLFTDFHCIFDFLRSARFAPDLLGPANFDHTSLDLIGAFEFSGAKLKIGDLLTLTPTAAKEERWVQLDQWDYGEARINGDWPNKERSESRNSGYKQ